LKRLGISKSNPTFRSGPVPVDKTGEPTGESPDYPLSVGFVEELLPPLTVAQQDEIVKQEEDERHALGITAVRELATWQDEVTALERLRREGKLTLRIALGLEFPDQKDLPAFIEKQPALQRTDPWLYVDSQSEEPWAPGSTTEEEFIRLTRAENRAGWRPAPHISSDSHRGTTADAATDDALAAYEAANQDNSIVGKRWYVEHVPFATPAQIDRMAALGLIVSVQSAGYDLPAVAPLPPDRMAHWNPVREFLDHKLVVVAGSDYHGPDTVTREPNNPIIDFYFYVTRRTRSGEVQTPAEKISRDEALRILTYNEAYATFQENVRGKIAPGMFADFVILNQNLMTVPDDKILATRAVATYVGGKRVYEAPASAGMGILQKQTAASPVQNPQKK
jgi:predicted amidohydrolase YtcJ